MRDYPLPIAAYLPDRPLRNKAPDIVPKTIAVIAAAPKIPSALRTGVPEPA